MVSIITVCLNSERTIQRTIESVLRQSSCNIEHLFIDGNSSDKTLNIINSYKDKYDRKNIKLRVISEPDNGLYDAMNKGIYLASGDIIGILNSDDWYEAHTIEIVETILARNNTIDIVMGAIRIHNGSQIIIKKAKNSNFLTTRHFNHPAMFVKKTCYNDLGIYEEGNLYADFEWFLRAKKKEKNIRFIDDILTNFSIGGVSTKKSFKAIRQKVFFRYMNYRKNNYTCLYYFECWFQEIVKYLLVSR